MLSYNFAFLSLVAFPSALAAPFVPPADVSIHLPGYDSRLSARSPGNFKLSIRHKLHESGGIHRRGTGSDGITFGSYWLAEANAGGQELSMLVDTGSADLWVVGPNVPADQQPSGVAIYNPTLSSTAVHIQGASFSIGYGTGGNGVTGSVWQDTFSMGTASVTNMPIGSAGNITGLSGGIFRSGIVGLAFQGGNSVKPTQEPTFMEALQPSLDSPVFVCNFKMGGGGTLEFGSVDTTLYTGALSVLQADNTTAYPASWSSEGVSYVSNGNTLGTFDIVFDTGGPSTSGPIAVVTAYYAQIAGAVNVNGDGSSWTVPCTTTMPDLEFHFDGGAVGVIPGANLLQGDNGSGNCPTWFGKENSPTRGLVGDAFFNSNVVIFNQADATISWAPQA